ncbi:hypothetical protein CKM354_000459000 [Cercospora kikuchii]|uniref:DUF7907 domain-containing protein n=1 Tax=Cercospora kikuchii TaxID=84275 RepID=A0A9P3FFX3_9PEZI|nr:uncharacterized protein CKM354_000459000 [Cercospora kikuchii]GIZ41279.1 hypothetical protein CKM354_000459000 [Cercospora kikuchii]
MLLIALILAIFGVSVTSVNITGPLYQIKTELQPSSANKTSYNNLWLYPFHTGAGLSDATFRETQGGASKAFFSPTNVTGRDNLLFDFGSTFTFGLKMIPNQKFYSAWQPVEMNAGVHGSNPDVSGFFVNETGLQWKSPGFGGWIVCDWWHGFPQLFFRINNPGYHYPAPASCAEVYLCPLPAQVD